ncbi:acetate kinase [Clostridium perfringens]|uniref:Acetate kinase n=1 Tax=Clostridium perfringens (strain SM101 / Type A) TaxID=289380 RepID=Q0SWF9_CLOPS|nr:acetate kinase [Clostridium perfringens]ABG86216.1 acetate kinase [Clostridium perfringens SM101]EJT5917125.1 acetate kinase [Clostridium perfringens]EJT6135758.1 acetate kinase [Clostridium perfringens]EJT6151004.1 acetate kinase [Clostridium perfringens]EJT6156691.1 acetate kinase [Clostridium perfringens]
MKILIINCGSSSLKYKLIDMANEKDIIEGIIERIGLDQSRLVQKNELREKYILEKEIKDHKEAIDIVLNTLVDSKVGVIESIDEITAVGHRVVHGGERYSSSIIINEEVIKYLEECSKLAPLHNPANIIGIRACQSLMPNKEMVAVFDTAFHGTLPEKAYIYAIDYALYKDHKIRKYGFHGTSHKYVSHKVAETMGKDIKDLKIITCHLGNGASISAIKGGECIDTTMGFTPLAGIPMGTRSGNIDPSIIPFLVQECGYTIEEVSESLNKKSGVLGISGVSSDFRDIEDAASNGDKRAQLALDIFHYRIRAEIGSFIVNMGGVDVIVFTAGVGENSPETREECLKDLEFLGLTLDKEKNKVRGKLAEISQADSKIKAYVVPTNEELMIAKETVELIGK